MIGVVVQFVSTAAALNVGAGWLICSGRRACAAVFFEPGIVFSLVHQREDQQDTQDEGSNGTNPLPAGTKRQRKHPAGDRQKGQTEAGSGNRYQDGCYQ